MRKLFLMLVCVFTILALVACGGGETPGEDNGGGNESKDKVYTITLVDGTAPIEGATVSFLNVGAGTKSMVQTDAAGKATFTDTTGTAVIKANVVSVTGYTVDMSKLYSFDSNGNLTVNLAPEVDNSKVTYTIYVVDQNGDPVEGVQVQICADTCRAPKTTDGEGKATDRADASKNWKAQITGETEYHEFDSDRTVTIVVER